MPDHALFPPVPDGRFRLKSRLYWPAFVLFLICAITTAALSATSALTRDPIARQEAQAKDDARRAALVASTFELIDLAALSSSDPSGYRTAVGAGRVAFSEASYGLDASGARVGTVVLVATRGYADGLSLMVGVASDGTISGISILTDNETPGLGKKIREAPFLSGFLGKPTANGFATGKSATGKAVPVDAITGATISSKAVVDAVNAAVRLVELLQKGGA